MSAASENEKAPTKRELAGASVERILRDAGSDPLDSPSPSQSPTKLGERPAELLIRHLEEQWPKCFSVFEKRRKLLKLGIHKEVIAALAGVYSETAIRDALQIYVANIVYLKKLIAKAVRVDLGGMPAGLVTKEEEEHAAQKIKLRKAARSEQQLWELPPAKRKQVEEQRAKETDPDGEWASNPHPANANKPKLSLNFGRRA